MNNSVAIQAIEPRVVWKSEDHGTTDEANFPKSVPKLIMALQFDCTISETCEVAGIPRRTFYNHLQNDHEFALEVEKAKNYPIIRAKIRIMDIIEKGSDRDAGPIVRWLLERIAPEEYGVVCRDCGKRKVRGQWTQQIPLLEAKSV